MASEISNAPAIAADVDNTWVASLGPTLMVYQSGTTDGRARARQALHYMAELADLAMNAAMTLERMVTEAHVLDDDVCIVLTEAQRLSKTMPCGSASKHQATACAAGVRAVGHGVLAKQRTNLELPLEVCYCARGFYIGTFCDAQPFTHESVEYWPKRETAKAALRDHTWTQRVSP